MQLVSLALFIFIENGLFLVSLVNHCVSYKHEGKCWHAVRKVAQRHSFCLSGFPAGQKRLKSVNFVTLTCVGDHGDSTQEIRTWGKYG